MWRCGTGSGCKFRRRTWAGGGSRAGGRARLPASCSRGWVPGKEVGRRAVGAGRAALGGVGGGPVGGARAATPAQSALVVPAQHEALSEYRPILSEAHRLQHHSSMVDKKLVLIPLIFICLRVWSTVRFVLTLCGSPAVQTPVLVILHVSSPALPAPPPRPQMASRQRGHVPMHQPAPGGQGLGSLPSPFLPEAGSLGERAEGQCGWPGVSRRCPAPASSPKGADWSAGEDLPRALPKAPASGSSQTSPEGRRTRFWGPQRLEPPRALALTPPLSAPRRGSGTRFREAPTASCSCSAPVWSARGSSRCAAAARPSRLPRARPAGRPGLPHPPRQGTLRDLAGPPTNCQAPERCPSSFCAWVRPPLDRWPQGVGETSEHRKPSAGEALEPGGGGRTPSAALPPRPSHCTSAPASCCARSVCLREGRQWDSGRPAVRDHCQVALWSSGHWPLDHTALFTI